MSRAERTAWLAIGAAALAVRLAYVMAQPAADPGFARPALDEAMYVGWARDLAAGAGQPGGAFYLAPLYPNLLVLWVLAGAGFGLLYALQHLLAVAAAAALAWTARSVAGPVAGVLAGVLALAYHPALFFASRPLGETVAVALLSFALAAGTVAAGPGLLSGALVGASALARPNLAPAALLLAAVRPRRAALVLAGAVALVAPITVRNWAVSGHLVPISSNGGITLYHGNGPGALGIYTPAEGFSGRVDRQRDEATRLASRLASRPMDAVQADTWWGRRALQVRADAPAGTAWLLLRRLGLLVSTREIGLDAAPSLDANPWRRAAPVPFVVLLSLAAAAAAGLGFGRSGGWLVWGTIATAAATPLVFYVSSRYRLPLALLLVVPAGTGAAALLGSVQGFRRPRAVAAALVAGALSLLVPSEALARSCEAAALGNRAAAWLQAGDVARAAADSQRAITLDAGSVAAWFNAGVVAERQDRGAAAERAYRRALALQPALVDAAGNLGGLLIRTGRAEEAAAVLERGLAVDPTHPVCWTNLVVARIVERRFADARAAVLRARQAGVALNPELEAAASAVAGGPS